MRYVDLFTGYGTDYSLVQDVHRALTSVLLDGLGYGLVCEATVKLSRKQLEAVADSPLACRGIFPRLRLSDPEKFLAAADDVIDIESVLRGKCAGNEHKDKVSKGKILVWRHE